MFENGFELIGCDREIKKSVATGAAFLVDLVQSCCESLEARFVGKIALVIENGLAESFPDFVADRLARKFSDGFFHLAAKIVVAFLATREPDDRNSRRQFAIGSEIIKRRQKFAVGQVTGRAKDDDAARLRDGASRQTFAQRIDFYLLGRSIHRRNCSGAL